jgi:hypothetical protein
MRTLIVLILGLATVFALFGFLNFDEDKDGTLDSFSFHDYLVRVQNGVPTPPPVPKFDNGDYLGFVDGSVFNPDGSSLFTRVGNFFEWFGNVFAYPLKLVLYAIAMLDWGAKVVYYVFGGLSA